MEGRRNKKRKKRNRLRKRRSIIRTFSVIKESIRNNEFVEGETRKKGRVKKRRRRRGEKRGDREVLKEGDGDRGERRGVWWCLSVAKCVSCDSFNPNVKVFQAPHKD